MKHLTPINRKAARVEVGRPRATATKDVVALQQGGPPQQPEPPHIPHGCSLVFSPGWEADRNGGTAGLCQPVERDLFDCHMGCFWPAQVPDQLNHAPDWTAKCAAAQKDWRKIDLIFPDEKKHDAADHRAVARAAVVACLAVAVGAGRGRAEPGAGRRRSTAATHCSTSAPTPATIQIFDEATEKQGRRDQAARPAFRAR